MTSRRGFLGALIGAAVLDPERLLWKPGKVYSIPSNTWREDGLDIRLISFYDAEINGMIRRFDAIYGTMWLGSDCRDISVNGAAVEAWFRQDWNRRDLPKLGRVVEVDINNPSHGLNWPKMRIG